MSSGTKKRKPLLAGPMLGALLRMARQEAVNHINGALQQAGFGDVSPSHYAVMQQLAQAPDGLRLTEMAAASGITKPSMSALVEALETRGYVARLPDPRDQRAQLIQLTDRGWRLGEAAQKAVQRVEQLWAERLGRRDVEVLRDILQRLVDSRPGLQANPSRAPTSRATPAPANTR
jgi:DNA-binding MarR family transcriptional regulator